MKMEILKQIDQALSMPFQRLKLGYLEDIVLVFGSSFGNKLFVHNILVGLHFNYLTL